MKRADFFVLLLVLTVVCCSKTILATPAPPIHAGTRVPSCAISSSTRTDSSGRIPWPRSFYTIQLISGYSIAIQATGYKYSDAPSSTTVQNLILQFSNDIKSSYPPPGLSPVKASLDHIDVESATKLLISEEASAGVFSSKPAPTAILVDALKKLALEVGKHRPSGSIDMMVTKKKDGSSWRLDQFNSVQLRIQKLALDGGSLITGHEEGNLTLATS